MCWLNEVHGTAPLCVWQHGSKSTKQNRPFIIYIDIVGDHISDAVTWSISRPWLCCSCKRAEQSWDDMIRWWWQLILYRHRSITTQKSVRQTLAEKQRMTHQTTSLLLLLYPQQICSSCERLTFFFFFWKGRAGSPGNSWNEQVLDFSSLLALLLFVWAAHFFSVWGRPQFTETENCRIPFYSHWWLTCNVTSYNSGLIIWNSCNAFINLKVTNNAKHPIFFSQ